MNRNTNNDDPGASKGTGPESGTGAGNRSPEEIERDIASIRARMDRTLDELEFRLSPGQLTSGAVDLVQDVMRGNPSRLGDAIRNNPIPVVMIGIGAAWLALAMGRSRQPEQERLSHRPADISEVLSPLIAITLQGVDSLRQAETRIADPQIQAMVREISQQHDRAASALEAEVRRHGALPTAAALPPGRLHPAWSELRRALATNEPAAIVAAVENGEDAALEAFRAALHSNLPEETRVLVGAHFHAIQQMHNRMSSIRNATA